MSRDEPLDLEFLATDAVRLVPVDFRRVGAAMLEPDLSNPLAFPPSTSTIRLLQPADLTNPSPNSDGLDVDDCSENLEHSGATLVDLLS
jgi:hypothetical protein